MNVRKTALAALALVLLLPATSSGAAPPTKLWYQVKVVYLASYRWHDIHKDGGKGRGVEKVAFVGKTNTSVLVRAAGGGSFNVSAGDFNGKVTSYSREFFEDWFVGTHAPCTAHYIEGLAQATAFAGVLGAEAAGAGRTSFGVSDSALIPTNVDEPALVPCAGSVRGRPIELINADKVNRGELPEYLVKEYKHPNRFGGIQLMQRVPSRERKEAIVRTVGKFGKPDFGVLAHLVVHHPATYTPNGIYSYDVDEAWSYQFTRCPGTSPC